MPGGEGPLRAVSKGARRYPPIVRAWHRIAPNSPSEENAELPMSFFLVLWPVYRSEQFRSIFPMAKSGQHELKGTTQLGCVAAVSPSLCSDDTSRPLIRPIPSALAAVAATKSNP
jgi:hypothetical protein